MYIPKDSIINNTSLVIDKNISFILINGLIGAIVGILVYIYITKNKKKIKCNKSS